MADSDNSRTLPAVTRGELHSSVAACLLEFTNRLKSPTHQPDDLAKKSVLSLWSQWSLAWQNALEANRHQRELEAQLLSAISSPDCLTEARGRSNRMIEHTKALEAEDHAFNAEGLLADGIWSVEATSLTDAIAKLHMILVRVQPTETHEEYPWPQIRSVLMDLLLLDIGKTAVDVFSGHALQRQVERARLAS